MTEFNTAYLRVKSLRGPSAKEIVILWKQRKNKKISRRSFARLTGGWPAGGIMLFLCNSRMAPGVKREQVIEYLTSTRMSPVGWDLVRREIISHVLWKVGERPGVAFTVNADGEKAIRRILDELEPVKSGLIEFDIDPVSPFRQFDQ